MTAIKDSNVLDLGGIVNKDAIRNDKIGELEDLDASVLAPTDYKYTKKLLFDDDDITSTDTTDHDSKLELSQTSEEQSRSESCYSKSLRSKSDSSVIDIKDPLLLSTTVKGVVDLSKTSKTKNKSSEDHTAILEEIKRLEKRADELKIGQSLPNYKDRDILKSKTYAIEIRNMLKNACDDNKIADSFEDALRFVLNILCKTFNGRHELFGYKINLQGYNVAVMHDIKELREDVVDVAAKVRNSVGRLPSKLFIYFKIFIINLGATIMSNNDFNDDHVFEKDFSDSDSEGYESESGESDDQSE